MIAHLRDVLGDQTYESLARKGETMTTADMVDVRIRPNRPGPSRTERCLEIDDICDSRKFVSKMAAICQTSLTSGETINDVGVSRDGGGGLTATGLICGSCGAHSISTRQVL